VGGRDRTTLDGGDSGPNPLDKLGNCIHNGSIMEPQEHFAMATITVKNIPPQLYELLKARATENHRSINSEVIVCIERAVSGRRADTADNILSRARVLREKTADYTASDEEFTRRKAAGRP
jgi:plasmid stability protein